MHAFEAHEVVARSQEHGELYLEFARGRTASVGLYTLPAGAEDPQGVHDEDEVYHVLEGRARLRVGDEDRAVGPGSIVYIDAGLPHGFHAIEAQLRVLVFFSESGVKFAGEADGADPRQERVAGAVTAGRSGRPVAASDAAVVRLGRSTV